MGYTFKVENVAPGHCTGEPTFAALKQAFGNRYIYAGVGTSLLLGPSTGTGERRGEGPALEKDELTTYRKLASHEDPFGVLQARSSRSRFLRSKASNGSGVNKGYRHQSAGSLLERNVPPWWPNSPR